MTQGMDFEETFEQFLDRKKYDATENALFSMVRIAFKAGWLAAGGAPLSAQPVIQLIQHKSDETQEEFMKTSIDVKNNHK